MSPRQAIHKCESGLSVLEIWARTWVEISEFLTGVSSRKKWTSLLVEIRSISLPLSIEICLFNEFEVCKKNLKEENCYFFSFPTWHHQGFPKLYQVFACFNLSLRLNSFWIFSFRNRSIIRLRISSRNRNAVPTEDTKEFCHPFWIMSTYFNVPSMAIETVNEIIYIMWRLSFLHEI